MCIFSHKRAETHTFADLIKVLQYAVSSAQEMLAAHQVNALNNYFNSDGTFVCKKVKTPDGRVADIPIIALVPHNTLQIDEISIDFNTKIKNLTDKKLLNSANSLEVAHADYDMTIESGTANGDDIMHVNVKFKASPSPEGLSRVIDEQNKVI